MAIVYQVAKANNIIRPYTESVVSGYTQAVIEPGKFAVDVPVAPLTGDEVDLLVHKLDNQLALSTQQDAIAKMIAEELPSIILMARMVKWQASGAFAGVLGAGLNLDMMWLRPKDVGGILLNPAATGGLGLYGGTSAGVYTWLQTFVANTKQSIIPAQSMSQYAGVIHLGFFDAIQTPKVDAVQFTLAGVPTPPQSLFMDARRENGGDYDNSFVRFEKPVIVGPLQKQLIEVMPNVSGDSKLELLSLVVARVQDLAL